MSALWFLVVFEWVGYIYTLRNVITREESNIDSAFFRLFAGTPALTTRGFTEGDFDEVAGLFDEAVKLAKEVKGSLESKFVCDNIPISFPNINYLLLLNDCQVKK